MFVQAKYDCYISLYVDDIPIYSGDNTNLKSLIKDRKTAFEITDLGEASFLLGLHLTYTPDRLGVTQKPYIDIVLKRFDMENSLTVSTPLPKGIQLKSGTEDERILDPSIYQSIIGSLMYVTTGTRPDLSSTLSIFSQFAACSTAQHLEAAKDVLKYLNYTKTIRWDFPTATPKLLMFMLMLTTPLASIHAAPGLDTRYCLTVPASPGVRRSKNQSPSPPPKQNMSRYRLPHGKSNGLLLVSTMFNYTCRSLSIHIIQRQFLSEKPATECLKKTYWCSLSQDLCGTPTRYLYALTSCIGR